MIAHQSAKVNENHSTAVCVKVWSITFLEMSKIQNMRGSFLNVLWQNSDVLPVDYHIKSGRHDIILTTECLLVKPSPRLQKQKALAYQLCVVYIKVN